MIPRRKVIMYKGMLKDIITAILTGKLIRGDEISIFEQKFAEYIGIKHAIAVSSGRFGMELLLRSLSLERGDEIILPAYTFYALPKIILNIGLKPVFIDIKKSNFGLDPSLIERKITHKTKVIIATHLFGLACDIDAIRKIAENKKIKVIEDCAHASGAEYMPGRKVGTVGSGAFFSFDTHKLINTFGGGMVVTNDDETASGIRSRLSQCRASYRKTLEKIFFNYLEALAVSWPINCLMLKALHNDSLLKPIKNLYRSMHRNSANPKFLFSNIQAIAGLRQLEHLDSCISKRKEIGIDYLRAIDSLNGCLIRENINFLVEAETSIKAFNYHVFLYFILLIEKAKKASILLSKKGVDTACQENVVENCAAIYNAEGRFPNTEFIREYALELPMFIGLNEEQIQSIVKKLKAVIS
jgi:dTDP-4-amino-4,6-dideoxygalactose transaminase